MSVASLILAALLALTALFGCGKLNTDGGGSGDKGDTGGAVVAADVYDVSDGTTREYLALPYEQGEEYIKTHRSKVTGVPHDYQPVTVNWKGNGITPYTVEFSRSSDYAEADTFTTATASLSPGTLLPSTDYYVRIKDGSGGVIEEKQLTTGGGVRWISARESAYSSGIRNVRDLGGWAAGDKRVAYGKIYRGGRLEKSITERGYKILGDVLKIKTEIDLRGARDDDGQTESPLAGCNYVKAPITGYTTVFPSETYADSVYYDDDTPSSLKTVFDVLADEKNYPVYFHCVIGQDRTGTLAYLINGLLGVGYEDLTRDYELSSFYKSGGAIRSIDFSYINHEGKYVGHEKRAWEKLNSAMIEKYGDGGTLGGAIQNYLETVCGVSKETIASLRRIMLA